MPKALLVYPKNPRTFWSYDETLKIIGRKCLFPPLGLLTVASLLPRDYELRLVDLNVTSLDDEDIRWADVILTSSMIIHWPSLEDVIARANAAGVPILNGGPLPTQYHEGIAGDGVFYLGEAENGFTDVVESMVRDRPQGRQVIDRRGEFKSLESTPVPRWDLIDPNDYATMMIQVTRGCPESCTFCNIPSLYGKTTRLRAKSRTVQELDAIYATSWRGMVMIVDDNFVGNREAIRTIVEEELVPWQKEHRYPFQLYTQASIRLTEDAPLMDAMYEAGFESVFIGIESPSADSLKFMGAQKNLQGEESLIEKIRMLQARGFQVLAGFIVGLDTDPPDIAEQTIQFIQEAGIPVAMAGILGVLPDTPDYKRYQRMGRLVEDVKYTGDSGLFNRELSFVPTIDREELFARHRKILENINRADRFYERCLTLLRHQTRSPRTSMPLGRWQMLAILRSVWKQGVLSSYRRHYWHYLWTALRRHPSRFSYSFTMGVLAHHQVITTEQALRVASMHTFCEEALKRFERLCLGYRNALVENATTYGGELLQAAGRRLSHSRPGDILELRHNAKVLIDIAQRQYASLRHEFRQQVSGRLASFQSGIEQILDHHASGPLSKGL
jgi:radical SAM superfamily enzyme YgiQ (UPF0313 family)